MEEKQSTLLVLSIAVCLTVVLGRCSPIPASSEAMSITPEKVVGSFYNWYVSYPDNLLVDGAYRSSEYLTKEFTQKVDGIVAAFDKGGYDPFLCAQDKPGNFIVDKAFVSGEKASVIVHEIWNHGTQYELNHNVTVTLRMVDGQWKIADILCPRVGSAAQMPKRSEPMISSRVVASFYDWYIGYAQNVGNPMVDKSYRSSEYLTEEFAQKVDGIIAYFDKGGYDPFLCAQDIPESFTLEEAIIFGDEASVFVHTSFEGHKFTVDLQRVEGEWKIADIVCTTSPPVTLSARTRALPPALDLQTFSGQGFAFCYPANARIEVYEDHLRILGPEIGVRPADADWGWMGWAYEMDIGIFDNPDDLSAAAWARQYILFQWREAQAAGEPFTGPVVNGQINEDAMAEVSVGGLPAFQADWFGGDSIRRAIYVTDGKRTISLIFNLYPVENNPIAKVQEDVYALMLSTFHFSEGPR